MDRSRVERARDYLRELISEGRLDQFALGHVGLVSRLLTTALDDPAASDPCDECECEGCKTTEPAPHDAAVKDNPNDAAHVTWEDLEKLGMLARRLHFSSKFGSWNGAVLEIAELHDMVCNLISRANLVESMASVNKKSLGEAYDELISGVTGEVKETEKRNDFGCLKFDPITDDPSDYEIRLKAWNIAYDFEWEDLNNEFDATLDAATKLYNFLSGRNEDTK